MQRLSSESKIGKHFVLFFTSNALVLTEHVTVAPLTFSAALGTQCPDGPCVPYWSAHHHLCNWTQSESHNIVLHSRTTEKCVSLNPVLSDLIIMNHNSTFKKNKFAHKELNYFTSYFLKLGTSRLL